MYQYKIANILKIVDGDTVDLSIDLGFSIITIQRIRLSGLDTPELNSKEEKERQLAVEAKQFVTEWFSNNKNLIIKTTKDDKYGRMLGEIINENGVSLNKTLIERGYAWDYDGTVKKTDINILLEKRKLWIQ